MPESSSALTGQPSWEPCESSWGQGQDSGWLNVTAVPVLTHSVPSQDSGSVELRIQDLAVAAVLGVSDDGSGHPTVWSAGCDTLGTDLHMEFHRGYR